MDIKEKVSKVLPKRTKNLIKNVYYDLFLENIYRIRNKFYYKNPDFFDSVQIETTTYCNLRCPWCPNSKYDRGLLKNKKLMQESLFKKIIDDLVKINFRGKILPYSYGDPLSDSRMAYFVGYIKSKLPHCKIILNSNGLLLTIHLYNQLINAGVDKFTISQYGNKMPQNIEEILNYLKSRPKKENKINYRIFDDNLAISNVGGEVKIKNLWDRPLCAYPRQFVIIDYAGNVILCCNDYHGKIKFGNLVDENLIDIWNKQSYREMRKELRKKIYKLPLCKRCMGLE